MNIPEDSAGLAAWMKRDGPRELGSHPNRWLSVIEYATTMVRISQENEDLRLYASAALTALAGAQRSGSLSKYDVVIRTMTLRLSLARHVCVEEAQRKWEMDQVARLFLEYVEDETFDIDVAREKARLWRNEPIATIKLLRQIKNLANQVKYSIDFLDEPRRRRVESWVALIPYLP